MQNVVDNTKRIANNTLLLYSRLLFSLVISLYSSRLVLSALGETDYGVYNVVGGVVSMFSIVTNSISGAIGRFLTFELGKNDKRKLSNLFSMSFGIQLGMSLLIVVLVETIGVWFLNAKMNIPPERMIAANWVLQFSMVSFVSSMLIVPYDACIVAHEKMNFYSVIGILDVLLKLGTALLIAYSAFRDKLIVYAAALMSCLFILQVLYVSYCKRKFEECNLHKPEWDKNLFKELFGFASWNFLGSTIGLLNGQGINIVLNLFCGAAVNAARGLAYTVNNIIANFVNNFMKALTPQIIKAYASNEMDYAIFLIYRGAKFSYFILLVLGLPVMFEADFLINLWLVDVPEHTVNFVRMILLLAFTDVLSNILGMAQGATGKIKYYQIASSSILSLNFICSYLLLRFTDFSPECVYVVAIAVSILMLVSRNIFINHSYGISFADYFKNVYLKLFVVTVSAAIIPFFIWLKMDDNMVRFFLVCAVCLISSITSILLLGCNKSERVFIFDYAKSLLGKLKRR